MFIGLKNRIITGKNAMHTLKYEVTTMNKNSATAPPTEEETKRHDERSEECGRYGGKKSIRSTGRG